jgi:hypothetical protein
MIELSLFADFPFKIKWKHLWDRTWEISPNKSLEIEIERRNLVFSFFLRVSFRGYDHAGPKLRMGLFCHEISIDFYDIRHWDREADQWEKRMWQKE